MASTINLKAVGLNTSPNQLDADPGSLSEASNVIIRRDNVVEPRRGFKLYGNSFGSSSDIASQLLSYRNTILRHYNSTLQWDDGSGTFTSFAGTYSELDPGLRIKGLETNGNFYFTTDSGIKKISATSISGLSSSSGFITNAGGVKALDTQAFLDITLGDESGFLPADSAVAYRVVWGITDANNNLILGTPSQRVEIFNPLSNLIAQDLNNTLRAIDNAVLYPASPGLLNSSDYLSTLQVDYNAAGTTLQTNMLALAAKLDADILYGNDSGSGAPLNLNTATSGITGGVCSLIFSAGNPSNYVGIGSKIYLNNFTPTTGTLNGIQTVASANATTITFTTTATGAAGTIAGATSTVTSGEYEYITSTGSTDFPTPLSTLTVDTPATHDELATIQDTLDRIMARLKMENSLVIDSAALTLFIVPLEITTSANVRLQFTIPDDVTNSYFYQIYRSSIVQATGVTVLSDLSPSDELQLVYEAFPTAAELIAQQISVIDVTPDAFRGANLYTNASTGEGILQSNDVPPAAKDINKFKNYTFYANTRTRQRLSINLLGVQQLIDDFDAEETPVITIANDNNSQSYKFITGLQEVTNFYASAGNVTAASTYFTANSANDTREYYFWFRKDGVGTDPALSGKIGVVIDIKNAYTVAQVSTQITETFEATNIDFLVSPISTTFTSSGVNTGTDTITVTYSGLLDNDVVQFTTSSALPAGISALTYYFLINTVDNGNGTMSFKISTSVGGSAVNITGTGTGTQTMSTAPGVTRVINVDEGPCTDATGGNSSVTAEVVRQGTGEDSTDNSVLLSQQSSVALAVDATARSLVKIINESSSSVYAYYLSGAGDVPGKILLESRTLGTTDNPFYVLANNTDVGSSFNPDISPEKRVNAGTSILKDTPSVGRVAFNVNSHGFVNGDRVIISGTVDATPSLSIDGVYTITRESSNQFSIAASIVSNAVVTANTVGVSLLSDSSVSNNEVKPNRVYYSKFQQPEAVPIVNNIDLGSENKAILRIVPLRDSLFVFKEDGLYRISGESAPFTTSLFDNSCILIAADSIGIVNNVIYGWTRKGIENITEAGITTISRPIDIDLLPKASSQYTNFNTVTWGTGYESDNSYIVFTVTETTDEVATIGYRFSNLTNSWTTFDKTNTCGIVGPVDDVLYMGAGDTNYIEKERKNFDRTDYADREYTEELFAGSIVSGGYGLKYTSPGDFAIGDVITQEQFLTIYEYNVLLEKLDIDPGVTDTDYFSTLEAVAGDSLRLKLVALAQKLDNDPNMFGNYTDRITGASGYSTTISGVSIADPTVITTSGDHFLYSITGPSEGRWITISGTNTNASTLGTFEITRTGATTFTIEEDVISVTTGTGSFVRQENDFRDIKACFNIIIEHLNSDPGVTFSNYSRNDTTTLQEAIVTDVDIVTKIITVNLALDFVVGPTTLYKKIDSVFTYTQQTMGDSLGFKQVREATIMFENKAFTSAIVSFSTDLLPEYIQIPFNADSNGIFGHGAFFGSGFFGGAANGAPFRTYIPATCQRCRYINMMFEHGIAREKYSIFGSTLTAEINLSSRAYK